MERAVVGSYRIDESAVLQSEPELFPVLDLSERRRHDGLESLLRIIVKLICEYQVLYAGLDTEVRPFLRPRFDDFVEALSAGEMHYVERSVARQSSQMYHAVHGFRLDSRRSAQRMILCFGASVFNEFLPELRQDSVVLAVDSDDYARFLCGAEDIEYLVVLEPVVICHVDLDAAYALFFLELGKFPESVFRDRMLHDSVEAVVDYGFSVSQLVVLIDLMPEAAVFGTKCHVIDYGSRSSAGSCDRSVIEVVDRARYANVEVHVRVNVDSTRDHVLARRVDDLGIARPKVLADRNYLFILDEDVAFEDLGIGRYVSVLDELFHVPTHFFLL